MFSFLKKKIVFLQPNCKSATKMVEPRNLFPEGTPIRRVINHATHEFFSKGIKQVTMDDIAKGLQMSKRTLYQLFADKEQLIIACLEVFNDKEHALVQQLMKEEYNVLEIFLRVVEWRMQLMEHISPQYIIDIARHKPIQEYMKIARSESITRSEEIFKIGVQQGLFRDDVNVQLLMRYMFTSHEHQGNSLFEEFNLRDCFINIGIFHLRGCCTPKGIELIDGFLEHYRNRDTAR